MKPTDDLFRLIKAMTRTEKRYCRLLLAQTIGREATGSLALFDAIARQSRYDEGKLREELAGHRFVAHLAVAKSDLYALLLKGLRAYHAGATPRRQVMEMIDAIEILTAKGLHDQARKMIRKAKGIATANDHFPEMLRLLYQEWRIDASSSYAGVTQDDLAARRDEVERQIEITRNLWRFVHRYALLGHHITSRGVPRSSEERRPIDDIISDPEIDAAAKALSPLARSTFYDIQILGAMMIGDYERAYAYSGDYIRLIESEKGTGSVPLGRHTISQHMLLCIRLERMKEAYQLYLQLEKMNGPSAPAAVTETVYAAAMEIHLALHNPRALIELSPEILDFCERHRNDVASQLNVVFRSNLAYAYFAEGEFAKALELLNEIMGMEGMRSDLQTTARLRLLMIHYEMSNLELLPYLWRSTYRYLSKRSRLHSVERVILDFMRELPAITTKRGLTAAFRRLRGQMQSSLDDPLDREMTKGLNLIPWLDAKIRGVSLTDVTRQLRKEYAKQLR